MSSGRETDSIVVHMAELFSLKKDLKRAELRVVELEAALRTCVEKTLKRAALTSGSGGWIIYTDEIKELNRFIEDTIESSSVKVSIETALEHMRKVLRDLPRDGEWTPTLGWLERVRANSEIACIWLDDLKVEEYPKDEEGKCPSSAPT